MIILPEQRRFWILVLSNCCSPIPICIENLGRNLVFLVMPCIIPTHYWPVACQIRNSSSFQVLLEFNIAIILPIATYLQIPLLWQVNWCRYCQLCRRQNWLAGDWLASRCKWRESTCRPGRRWKRPDTKRQRLVDRLIFSMDRHRLINNNLTFVSLLFTQKNL